MSGEPTEEMAKTIVDTIREEKPQTVRELVDSVQERLQIPEENIIESVMYLRREGRIKLREPPKTIPERLVNYLKMEEARWYWITIALAAVTTLVVFTIPENLIPLAYIRYVLGTIYVLWLPGYTFTRALFPKTIHQKSLDNIERIALSIGLSLALVPITGLLLNYTPWGIRLTSIVLSLFILITLFSTAAIVREHQTQTRQET